jgi:hypothetical protein
MPNFTCRDSLVDIVTDYGLQGWGSFPCTSISLRHLVQTCSKRRSVNLHSEYCWQSGLSVKFTSHYNLVSGLGMFLQTS